MTPTDEELKALLEATHKEFQAVYTSRFATQQVRNLPPEQLLRLAELQAERTRRRDKRASAVTLAVMSIASPLILFVCAKAFGAVCLLLGPVGIADFWFVFVGNVYKVFRKDEAEKQRRFIEEIIEDSQDVHMMGVTLTLLSQIRADKTSKAFIAEMLQKLLPRLRADQPNALTPELRDALLAILKDPYTNVELTLSVLKALEQIGDASVAPAVRELAYGGAATANMRSVRQAAKECLSYLSVNTKQQQQAQTLLRASSINDADSLDMLLRAAAPTESITASEQLLRAAAPQP